jgi:hypothetical protein
VTVCVSYLDRDGHAIGLAAAVRTRDYEAIDIVQQTMRPGPPRCARGGC